MLIVFCTIFVGASYAVAAPTARFLELNGFEDNSTNEKQFTANDFAGTYSRFMELSRSGHLCPKSLELLSNGVLKSDGSVQIQHVDAKLNNKRCISDGSLSFHFGRRLEKSFIENQLKLPRESNGIEAVIRNIVFQLKNFYYAVEAQHIECGGASLFSGTVLLFTSDSEVFGRALQIPWSGHPRIAFLRDRQKSCAFNGTWLPQREGPIPIKSPAPVSLESSPSSMENEDTTAVPTEKPDFISSPAPPESDVSEANPTVTTVPPSSSAAISSTSAVKTSATAPSSSTKKRPPPPRRKVPASSGSRGPPPTSTIPFTTTSKTTSSGTATVTTPSSSLSSDSMTSATTISGTTTTVTSTAGMTTSAIATSSTGAAKKEPSATFPTSTTTQDVTTTVPESSASTAGTATEATPTSSATTSTMGTPTSTAGTSASTVFAPSATTKSPVTTIATMTTGVGPTFSTIIVTTLPTGTPVTTASSATNSPASVSSTRPTVSSTVTNAPVTPQPEATSLNVTDSNNPDPPVAPGTDNSFQTSSPVTASTVAASVTSPKSLPPTTSRTISPTVTPTTPVTTPTGGSSTTAGIFSSPKPSIPAGPGEQVNASVEHGSPIFTKGPILFGDKEIPSPSDLLEESPMPSLSPGGNETIPMPSTDAPVSPLPSKSIEPSPPPRQNSGASDESSDGSTCFPAHVLVKLSTGQKIRMDNIDTGDVVFVGEGQTSKVVGFTHSDRHAISKFVRFTTDSGKVLEVTSTHFVYTQRGLAQAGKVTKSDFLQLEEGRMTKVITIDSVLARGLFNPHTVSGDIVVNDFVTSTYTTAVDPSIAHALLAPIRVLEGLGTKTSIVTMLSGNPWIVCMARRFFSGDLS